MSTTVIVLFLSALFDVGICCLRNVFAKNALNTASDNTLYSMIITIAALPVLFLLGGYRKAGEGVIPLSVVFGFLIAFEQFVANEAFKNGAFSLSSLMAQAGMLITILDACIRWGEKMTPKSGVGIVLMLCAMALMMNVGKEKTSLRWFLFAFLWMCACGFLGVVQKTFTVKLTGADMYVFLFWSFLFSVLFLFAFLLLSVKGMKAPVTVPMTRKIILSAALTGVLYMGLHIYALIGVGTLPAGYFFPVCNGLKLAAEILSGAFLFHEKLSRKQMAGLFIGFAAILLLS